MNNLTHPAAIKTSKTVITVALISLGYLLLSYILIGFKTDQLYLVAFFNLLYFTSAPTRKFITGFSIFIVFWIIFDYMKAFPNYRYNLVHIEGLYNAEKNFFGFIFKGIPVTPNEYFLTQRSTVLDLFTGFCYLCWMPLPLIFAGYLFYKKRIQFFYFSLTFLLVNILGFIIYYVYPAAPPWYVHKYGFIFHSATPGSTAGLEAFDRFFHVGVFKGLYAKSSNVFAAMPSLHAAYPLIVLYYGLKNKLGWVNIIFALITAGIWFAAVYNSHHYILDVIAGILTACTGIILFRKFFLKQAWFNRFINYYYKATE